MGLAGPKARGKGKGKGKGKGDGDGDGGVKNWGISFLVPKISSCQLLAFSFQKELRVDSHSLMLSFLLNFPKKRVVEKNLPNGLAFSLHNGGVS